MNVNDKKIGLVGYGAVGKQVEKLLIQSGIPENNIFYFDDQFKVDENQHKFKFADFTDARFRELHFLPTIGYLSLNIKQQVFEKLVKSGLNIHSFIHQTAFVNPSATIGRGVIIYPMSNIDQNVILEDGVLLNNSCVISHDSRIREGSYLSPGVVVSGFVDVGAYCFVGSNSTISNGIAIGDNCSIGIASCIIKNIEPNQTVIGNPAVAKSKIKLI